VCGSRVGWAKAGQREREGGKGEAGQADAVGQVQAQTGKVQVLCDAAGLVGWLCWPAAYCCSVVTVHLWQSILAVCCLVTRLHPLDVLAAQHPAPQCCTGLTVECCERCSGLLHAPGTGEGHDAVAAGRYGSSSWCSCRRVLSRGRAADKLWQGLRA
jgi:hypothetical protein